MVLVGYGSKWCLVEGTGEGGVDGLPYLQYINFLGLGDKKSVIVGAIISAHASGTTQPPLLIAPSTQP